MTTSIGRAFDGPGARRAVAPLVVFAIIVADWLAVRHFGRGRIAELDAVRVALALAAAVALLALARWDRASLGLTLRPAPSVRWWLAATAILGVLVGGASAGAMFVAHRMGYRVIPDSMFTSSAQFGPFVLEYCVLIVLFEETIYRLGVCAASVRLVGPWGAVLLSGVVFTLLHQMYGNLTVTSAVAGFVLGWAYLRSGSLLVPMALHALGNGSIGAFHAVLYYVERAR